MPNKKYIWKFETVISILISLSKPKGNLVPSFTLFHREKVTNLILFSLGKKASPFLVEVKKIQSPSPQGVHKEKPTPLLNREGGEEGTKLNNE